MFANMKASYSMHNESINYPYYDKKVESFLQIQSNHILYCYLAFGYNCFTAIAFLILFEMVYLHL